MLEKNREKREGTFDFTDSAKSYDVVLRGIVVMSEEEMSSKNVKFVKNMYKIASPQVKTVRWIIGEVHSRFLSRLFSEPLAYLA